ncbi:MAG: hypothetical protein ABSE49_10655 [Polyangiaceae bacterium]|jgi:hypothetical protein
MVDPVGELKTRAEILQGRIAAGDAPARARLRALPELARAGDEALAEAAARVRRKHCLAVVARELGFGSWEHAQRVLRGDAREQDHGTLMYGREAMGTLNVWYADYREARAHLDEARRAGNGRYLFPYRTQFFIVERLFVEGLGLDPDDADWVAIEYDWARPRDPIARQRLLMKRLDALRGKP